MCCYHCAVVSGDNIVEPRIYFVVNGCCLAVGCGRLLWRSWSWTVVVVQLPVGGCCRTAGSACAWMVVVSACAWMVVGVSIDTVGRECGWLLSRCWPGQLVVPWEMVEVCGESVFEGSIARRGAKRRSLTWLL